MSHGRIVRFAQSITVNKGDYNSVRFEVELQEVLGPEDDRLAVLAELRDEVGKFLRQQVKRDGKGIA
jgi:hypothetical protein